MTNRETLFDRQKADKLSKVDLSRKGSVDAPIFDFLNNLNSHQDYVSLSSCSGRIIIFISGENVKKVCSTLVLLKLIHISFNCFGQFNISFQQKTKQFNKV